MAYFGNDNNRAKHANGIAHMVNLSNHDNCMTWVWILELPFWQAICNFYYKFRWVPSLWNNETTSSIKTSSTIEKEI